MLKKIVVIGPESTGKSTLCEQLGAYYRTTWCPEFAREYLLTHGKKYNYDDLLTIAIGQITQEEKYIQHTTINYKTQTTNHQPLFIDTDMYVMKVWSEFVFGKCHRYILDQIVERKYNLYLLCNIDLPWIKDELREYPDHKTRQKLYRIYTDIMINQPVPWMEISGNKEGRLQKAIKTVDSLMKN